MSLVSLRKHLPDWAIAAGLALAYYVWLINTVGDLGYARDEGFYFQAADSYREWFKQLFEDPAKAITQAAVDKRWKVNNEHPALIKTLFAFSRWWLHDELGLFAERGTAYRFVGMVLSSVAVALTYLWGRVAFSGHGALASRSAALVSAASFALIPRVFYHSHLDCFDMPVLAMWLVTSYVYWRGLTNRSWVLAASAGVLYGLLLNTKHNSWLLPFALVAHLLYMRGPNLLSALRSGRFRRAFAEIPASLWWMATLGPLVFWATWPWIWFDTVDRFRDYVIFHTKHVYYNMEFLGRTYFEPPFPRSYAPLMTLATVPAITLALAGAGMLSSVKLATRSVAARWQRYRADGFWSALDDSKAAGAQDPTERAELSTYAMWLLFIAASYAPWLSNSSPIFGGTKHWITAYPFMCLFAGVAFLRIARLARASLTRDWWQRGPLPEALLTGAVLIAPLSITIHSHPWGLSTYTPIVGGSPGGATLGLNRSYWGYTTGAVQDEISELAPRNAKVFIHDTAMVSWQMMARDKRVDKGLRPQIGVANSQFAVYHHEQHMSRVEHQIWTDYGTVRPVHVAGPDGVPVVWLYDRTKRSNEGQGSDQ
jgi:4-amino-4-deoxy-L-arabinose transferase-like glycosyltransferase